MEDTAVSIEKLYMQRADPALLLANAHGQVDEIIMVQNYARLNGTVSTDFKII